MRIVLFFIVHQVRSGYSRLLHVRRFSSGICGADEPRIEWWKTEKYIPAEYYNRMLYFFAMRVYTYTHRKDLLILCTSKRDKLVLLNQFVGSCPFKGSFWISLHSLSRCQWQRCVVYHGVSEELPHLRDKKKKNYTHSRDYTYRSIITQEGLHT